MMRQLLDKQHNAQVHTVFKYSRKHSIAVWGTKITCSENSVH